MTERSQPIDKDAVAAFKALIEDELFDASTSPATGKSAAYGVAWFDGYDAALKRLLERLPQLAKPSMTERSQPTDGYHICPRCKARTYRAAWTGWRTCSSCEWDEKQ